MNSLGHAAALGRITVEPTLIASTSMTSI